MKGKINLHYPPKKKLWGGVSHRARCRDGGFKTKSVFRSFGYCKTISAYNYQQ